MTDHRYDLLDIKELAGAIHKSVRWIRSHLDEIPHIRLGTLLLFRPSEIDQWLDDNYREVNADSPFVRKAEEWYRGVLERKG